jgi:hypothetical protein
MCQSFSIDAQFEIAGASQTSPISVTAVGIDEIRPVLAVMIRTFKLTEQTILSMIIEGPECCGALAREGAVQDYRPYGANRTGRYRRSSRWPHRVLCRVLFASR